MISRRDLIKWGAVAPALAASGAAASQPAFARMPAGLDALLLDERFSAPPTPDHAPDHDGIPIMRFSGDVTQVWYDVIDARWRSRGYVLGGITGTDALFVLEVLANHHGRRVVSRTMLDEAPVNGIAPVSWVIAPHHPSVMV